MFPDSEESIHNPQSEEQLSASSDLSKPGRVIDERYEILSFLGRGGMANVYLANHLILNRAVALKVLRQNLQEDKLAIERFRREAIALSGLDHPNIIKIFGFGVFENLPYFAMEYFEGMSLEQLLKKELRLPRERALPLFNQMLDALSHAHEHGVIHRDLKPSNVLLTGPANDELKLVDFGIAKLLNVAEGQKLTGTGHVLGTAAYMSPEQCQGRALDARSDLYSAACLMFEMLDGRAPFEGETALATMSKHLSDTPRKSEFLNDELGAVIISALAKEPEKRPQSASEFKYVLNEAKSNLKLHGTKATTQDRAASLRKVILAGVFVFIAISIVVLLPRIQRIQADKTAKSSREYENNDNEERRLENSIHKIEKVTRNSTSSSLADSYDALALQYLDHGKAELAESCYQHAVSMYERILSTCNDEDRVTIQSELAKTLLHMSGCCCELGKHNEASKCALQAYAIGKRLGRESNAYRESLQRLAEVCYVRERYAEAAKYEIERISIDEKLGSKDYDNSALTSDVLSKIRLKQGHFSEAETLAKRAIELREQLGGDHLADLCGSLDYLALAHANQGKFVEAEVEAIKALKVREDHSRKDDRYIAIQLDNLSTVYKLEKKYSKAESAARRSLEIREKKQPKAPLDLAFSLNRLAELLMLQERDKEAQPLMARAFEIEDKLIPTEPECARTRHCYINLLRHLKRDSEADSLSSSKSSKDIAGK